MARDKVFMPRFYVDHLQFIKHAGILGAFDLQENINLKIIEEEATPVMNIKALETLLDFNPVNDVLLDYAGTWGQTNLIDERGFIIPTGMDKASDYNGAKWYFGVLNHSLFSSNAKWNLSFGSDLETFDPVANTSEIMNSTSTGLFNGFSLEQLQDLPSSDEKSKFLKFNFLSRDNSRDYYDTRIGALTFGKIYDVPISPDVKLEMSYEYGTKSKETRYGSTIVDSTWWQKPSWSNRPPWELNARVSDSYAYEADPNVNWRKSGRRVYELEFSFMTDDQLLATSGVIDGQTLEGNLHEGDLTEEVLNADGTLSSASVHDTLNPINIKNDNSLYAQLLHKTCGFTLPFLFQPDKSYSKPDGIMIARVDSRRGFSCEQLAPGLWKTKLTIKEVW
jgi:hypothetical protein